MCIYIYIYIYIYISLSLSLYIYIYIYIYMSASEVALAASRRSASRAPASGADVIITSPHELRAEEKEISREPERGGSYQTIT